MPTQAQIREKQASTWGQRSLTGSKKNHSHFFHYKIGVLRYKVNTSKKIVGLRYDQQTQWSRMSEMFRSNQILFIRKHTISSTLVGVRMLQFKNEKIYIYIYVATQMYGRKYLILRKLEQTFSNTWIFQYALLYPLEIMIADIVNAYDRFTD